MHAQRMDQPSGSGTACSVCVCLGQPSGGGCGRHAWRQRSTDQQRSTVRGGWHRRTMRCWQRSHSRNGKWLTPTVALFAVPAAVTLGSTPGTSRWSGSTCSRSRGDSPPPPHNLPAIRQLPTHVRAVGGGRGAGGAGAAGRGGLAGTLARQPHSRAMRLPFGGCITMQCAAWQSAGKGAATRQHDLRTPRQAGGISLSTNTSRSNKQQQREQLPTAAAAIQGPMLLISSRRAFNHSPGSTWQRREAT